MGLSVGEAGGVCFGAMLRKGTMQSLSWPPWFYFVAAVAILIAIVHNNLHSVFSSFKFCEHYCEFCLQGWGAWGHLYWFFAVGSRALSTPPHAAVPHKCDPILYIVKPDVSTLYQSDSPWLIMTTQQISRQPFLLFIFSLIERRSIRYEVCGVKSVGSENIGAPRWLNSMFRWCSDRLP